MVGTVDEHRIGIGHVQPAFDDQRRHQNVDFPVDELRHHRLQLALLHLSVPDRHARARHEPLQMISDGHNRLDPIVDEKDLPATVQLPRHGFFDQRIVPRLHEGEHRRTIARRRLHDREIAQPR